MSEYTAGPWEVVRWKTPRNVSRLGVFAGNDKVADVTQGNPADANLIAAAPDLLALAQQVATFWNDPLAFGDEATVTRLAGQFAPLAYAARNALDKAEGREL